MTKHLFPFFAALILGAVIALAVRSAKHHPAPTTDSTKSEVGPDLRAGRADSSTTASPSIAPSATPPAPTAATPVNTLCAICGMDVDPSLPTATYQGKTIGFGCRMCPPKFKADPDRYGPAYLANKVLEN
jgi:YHS domain-containing protein